MRHETKVWLAFTPEVVGDEGDISSYTFSRYQSAYKEYLRLVESKKGG